jgi:hypothetical protein
MAQIAAMSERERLGDKETREHGEYRTKRLVRKRGDALAAAIASGKPYVSPLSPPPGGPRAVLPPDRQDTGERNPHGS